jgi:hypothetical protein
MRGAGGSRWQGSSGPELNVGCGELCQLIATPGVGFEGVADHTGDTYVRLGREFLGTFCGVSRCAQASGGVFL